MPTSPQPEEKPDYQYTDARLDLSETVSKPRYDAALDWMKSTESKALALDIWARGNYTRRLMYNRQNEASPVIVPFQYVDELRWAHRRLALMGLPIEFVYTGALGSPTKTLTLHPGGDYMIDAGWGYVAALGSTLRKRGREWFPVIGVSKLMPEPLLDWLADEVSNDFQQGKVFLAPAELIGIGSTDFDAGSQLLTDIEDGLLVSDAHKATSVFASLDLPYLDNLSPAQFNRLLVEHEDDLVRFRMAIRKLVKGSATPEAAVEEIAAEVAEMRYSDSQQRLRASVSRFGGVFTTFAATVGAAAGALARGPSPETLVAAAGAATFAAAAATLVDLSKQAADRRAKLREKKFSLFWNLGVQSPSAVRRRKAEMSFHKYNRSSPVFVDEAFDCHWLCPPTAGLQFLAIRRTPDATSGT